MRKQARRNIYYDALHKGSVVALMGLTIIGGGVFAYCVYDYYFNIKPKYLAIAQEKQTELLQEGSSDKILLLDKAKELA